MHSTILSMSGGVGALGAHTLGRMGPSKSRPALCSLCCCRRRVPGGATPHPLKWGIKHVVRIYDVWALWLLDVVSGAGVQGFVVVVTPICSGPEAARERGGISPGERRDFTGRGAGCHRERGGISLEVRWDMRGKKVGGRR